MAIFWRFHGAGNIANHEAMAREICCNAMARLANLGLFYTGFGLKHAAQIIRNIAEMLGHCRGKWWRVIYA